MSPWRQPILSLSGSPIPSGRRRSTVRVQTARPVTEDGDGGYTEPWEDSGPYWQVAIEPATAQSLERIAAGTSIGSASHVVTGPYRSDVTLTASLLLEDTRRLNIVGKSDPGDRHIELVLLCQEVIA